MIIHTTFFRIILLAMFLGLLSNCARFADDDPASDPAKSETAEKKAIDWTKEFKVSDAKVTNAAKPMVPEAKDADPAKPRFKSLSPLDSERVSLSFAEENAAQVLQVLAHAAALNLVVADGMNSKTITAEYLDMPIREVLDSVCRILNVVWTEESGTIYIEHYREKIIDLDFLGVVRKSNFSVGGDVLGGGAAGGGKDASSGTTPLSGNFQIDGGITDTVSDIYTNIEKMVEKMLGSDGSFALNRQTGTLSLHASPKAIGAIENYLNVIRQKYRRQVLIEAKIIEVSLDNKHEMGIDWRTVGGVVSNSAINTGSDVVNITPSVTQDDSFFTMSVASKFSDISGIFRALEEYGSLSVLSNPRLKTMNGQPALISVGQSVAYIKSFKRTTTGTGDNKTTENTTDIGSVFDGVLLGVTPIIEKNNVIALHVVPIKSDLIKLDTVEFGSSTEPFQVTLPRVNLRELSTVSRVKSGDIVLLGGLIMEVNDKNTTGLPVLANASVMSWLFGVKKKETKKVELVVALQVQVVDSEAN